LKRGKILAKEKKRFLDPHIGQLCDSSAFNKWILKIDKYCIPSTRSEGDFFCHQFFLFFLLSLVLTFFRGSHSFFKNVQLCVHVICMEKTIVIVVRDSIYIAGCLKELIVINNLYCIRNYEFFSAVFFAKQIIFRGGRSENSSYRINSGLMGSDLQNFNKTRLKIERNKRKIIKNLLVSRACSKKHGVNLLLRKCYRIAKYKNISANCNGRFSLNKNTMQNIGWRWRITTCDKVEPWLTTWRYMSTEDRREWISERNKNVVFHH